MTTDRDLRRERIARAVQSVVAREGLAAATVRAVAAEAGVATGTVRHFFPSQDELRRVAMRVTVDGITDRLAVDAADRVAAARDGGRDGALGAVRVVLDALLPLDDRRRREAGVYAAFAVEAPRDTAIAAIHDETEQQLDAGVRHVVTSLDALGHLRAGRDVDVETDRLRALLDGLSALLLADRLDAPRARAVLDAHLQDLT